MVKRLVVIAAAIACGSVLLAPGVASAQPSLPSLPQPPALPALPGLPGLPQPGELSLSCELSGSITDNTFSGGCTSPLGGGTCTGTVDGTAVSGSCDFTSPLGSASCTFDGSVTPEGTSFTGSGSLSCTTSAGLEFTCSFEGSGEVTEDGSFTAVFNGS